MAAEVLSKTGSRGQRLKEPVYPEGQGLCVQPVSVGSPLALTEGGEQRLVTARCSPFLW